MFTYEGIMVNPSNNNTTRAIEQAVSTGAVQVSRKGVGIPVSGVSTHQDTAELSSISQDHAVYLNALKQLPDVRPDAVSAAKRSIGATIKYPPLDVIAGIGKLVGQISNSGTTE
jgi:hypothetical protein